MKKLFLLFSITFLFVQCKKEEMVEPLSTDEIIQTTIDNSISDEEEIKANLIGEWKLIEYRCGFCIPSDPLPTATIVFLETTGVLTYDDEFQDEEVVNFTWNLEEVSPSNDPFYFKLKTDPLHRSLNIEIFSDQYMMFDHTPLDGEMMLFEKQ